MRVVIAICLLIAGTAAADTPIKGLTLQSDANAGGYSWTNLSPSFASQNGLAPMSNLTAVQSLVTGTNVTLGLGASVTHRLPYAYVATNSSVGGFYYTGPDYGSEPTYTNGSWVIWNDGFDQYISEEAGVISSGWSEFSFSGYPFLTYAPINSSTTGNVTVATVGMMPAAQIGVGTNTTPGTVGWMGRPLARWDGAVYVGTAWVDRIYVPLLYGGGRMVTVTNDPVLNGLLIYGPDGTASWQVPTNLTVTATNVTFSGIGGDPDDNPALAADLDAIRVSVTSGVVTAGTWRNPEWFEVTWAQFPTSAPDSTTYRTNQDQLIARQGYNITRHDRIAQISEQHAFFDLSFSASPTNIGSVSSNGYLSHLADGTVTAVVSAASFARTNLLVLRTEGGVVESYWGGSAGSLRETIISNVAAHVTNASMQTFSTYLPPTNFIRNTNLWIKPAPECLAAWNNSNGFYRGGVLITPKHAIVAAHYSPNVGAAMYWVDSTNGTHTALVQSSVHIASDLQMLQLSTNVLVRRAKFLASPASLLPTGIQHLPLALGEVHSGYPEFQLVIGQSADWVSGLSWWKAADQSLWRALFKHYPIGGDSSQPVMFSTGSDFVLLFCLWYPTTGPSVHSYLSQIQAAITALGDTNTIEYLDVSNYTEF